MGKVAAQIGPLVAALSIFKFAADVWTIGLSEPFRIVIDQYERIAAYALAPIVPVLQNIVELISIRWNLDLQLYPHWAHLFVPLSLFVSSDVLADWGRRHERSAFVILASLTLAYGYVIALAGGLFVGVTPLTSQSVFLAVLAMMAFIVYQVIRGTISGLLLAEPRTGLTRTAAVSNYLYRFAFFDFLMAVLTIMLWQLGLATSLYLPPLSLVLIFMFAMCLPRFLLPLHYTFTTPGRKELGFAGYFSLGTVVVGQRILTTLFYFLVFLLGNYLTAVA